MSIVRRLFISRRGITLTELLVAASLITVVAFPAGLMLINNARIFEDEQIRMNLQGNAFVAMNGVCDMLQAASGIQPTDVGTPSSDGYAAAKQLRVLKSGGIEETITVKDDVLELNGKFLASGILLEIQPVEGILSDCRGLNIRVTARKVSMQGAESFRLVNRIYFRNGD